MKYRRFGKTNIEVPIFSLGGMRFQDSWKDKTFDEIDKFNQENLKSIIDKSIELGINHIETAHGYGTSEVQLGKILPKLKRDSIVVQTKVAPSDTNEEFTKNFEISLKKLQLDYVDFLAIHGINDETTYNWTMKKNGVLSEAKKLQERGLCKHIGFSTHGSSDIIQKTIQTKEFDYVNLHWYYIFQKHWQAIKSATSLDMGIFIISPNDKGGKLYNPSQKLVNLCKPLSPMIFNDLFCLSKNEIHTLSLGISKPSEFDEHIEALKYYNSIDTVIKPIVEKLDNELEKIIDKIGFNYWDENLISNWEKNPGNMNIQIIFWLWHMVKAFDMFEYGKMRYNLLGNGGHWFPGEKVQIKELKNIHSIVKDSNLNETICNVLSEAHKLMNDVEKKRLSES